MPMYLLVRPASEGGPAPAGVDPLLAGRGCRIPRSQLRRVTGEQASSMADLSGCLVTGSMTTAPGGAVGTDWIIEANRNSYALLERSPGTAGATFDHVTVSGLQLDDDGWPVRCHEINRLVYQGGMTITGADIKWGNDGWGMGSDSVLRDSYLHSHTLVFKSGQEQHRDGVQMQQGSGQEVVGNTFDSRANPVPPMRDGSPTPGAPAASAASSFIINHDREIAGVIRFNRNINYGGSSVMLSIESVVDDPKRPETQNAEEWWVQQRDADGVLVKGLEVLDNIVEERSTNGIVLAPLTWLRDHFGNWSKDARRDSIGFQVRKPDGTLTRHLERDDLVPFLT